MAIKARPFKTQVGDVEVEGFFEEEDFCVVIEEYPDDARGPSCLILGHGMEHRPIHVVCSPKPHFLAIITAYLPDRGEWSDDFKVRTKR